MSTSEQRSPSLATTVTRLDRRSQRTRRLLREALFALIVERGYDGMTILDITERANLGRTTFYLHYQDKDELLQASIQALMQELQADVEPYTGEMCPYRVRFTRVFTHVAERRLLYRALLQETGSVNTGAMMRAYFVLLLQRYLLAEPEMGALEPIYGEVIAAHAAGALFGLISWWINQDGVPIAGTMGTAYVRLMTEGAGYVRHVAEAHTLD